MYRNHPYYEEKKCDGIRQMLDVNSVKFENKTAIEYIKQEDWNTDYDKKLLEILGDKE